MSTINPDLQKKLDAEREQDIQNLLKLLDAAYRQKLISKVSDAKEVVFTVRVPHGESEQQVELFRLAGMVQG